MNTGLDIVSQILGHRLKQEDIQRLLHALSVRDRDEFLTTVIGVTQLLNKRDGEFTADDLTLLEAITAQASAALQNAQLFEQVQRAREEETQLLEVTTAMSTELQLQPNTVRHKFC